MAVSASTCRSDVWEFYEKSDGKMTCKLCSKELVYRGGTLNLREHLNRIHKKEYHPSRRIANQRTIENSFSNSVRDSFSESRAKRITELIVEMIAIDMRPLRLFQYSSYFTSSRENLLKAGFIVNHLWSYLKPGKVNALLFLNKNLQQLS